MNFEYLRVGMVRKYPDGTIYQYFTLYQLNIKVNPSKYLGPECVHGTNISNQYPHIFDSPTNIHTCNDANGMNVPGWTPLWFNISIYHYISTEFSTEFSK